MTDREKVLEEALRTVVGASNGSDVDAIGEALYAAEQLLAQPAASPGVQEVQRLHNHFAKVNQEGVQPAPCARCEAVRSMGQAILDAGPQPLTPEELEWAEAAARRVVAPPEAQQPAPPTEGRCVDCGVVLDPGTAKVFTACDSCWDKKYPPPAPPEVEHTETCPAHYSRLTLGGKGPCTCAPPEVQPARVGPESFAKLEELNKQAREDIAWAEAAEKELDAEVQPAAEALCRCYGDNFPLRDGCVPHASTPAPHPDTLPRFSVREMGAFLTPRVFEVAERMVASGPALAQVSNSEIHEVVDALLDVRRSLGLSRREGT